MSNTTIIDTANGDGKLVVKPAYFDQPEFKESLTALMEESIMATPGACNEDNVTIEQAKEALESMDDFARMADVDAMGARGVLERFIKQAGEAQK